MIFKPVLFTVFLKGLISVIYWVYVSLHGSSLEFDQLFSFDLYCLIQRKRQKKKKNPHFCDPELVTSLNSL